MKTPELMKMFVGQKKIHALPMTRAEYNEYRGWELPENEDGSDEGYLVEYVDGGQANHPAHSGYISWSPKHVFEQAYSPVASMGFEGALMFLKQGHCVARHGWNGKNQFVYMIKGSDYQKALGYGFGEYKGEPTICSGLAIKTTSNEVQVGWLASQSDMLADDWYVVN